MSIWSAIFAARRAADPKQPADRRIPVSNRTLAGVVITADNCITVPTVWACLRYLSQTTAVLPWRVMRPGERGSERADKHPVDYLLNTRPNPEWSAFQFRESLVHWALRWGNGYAEIERDTMGRPIAMWPIHPARVQPMRDPEGALFFRVDNGSAMPPSDIDHADMFHVRGFGEGVIGINLVEYAAESIGWARAAQLFGAGFFGQGMNVAGVIESKKPLSEPGLARLKSQMARLYRGVRGERVMYLDAGMEFKAIGMEPNKGQFLETNMYLVEEICFQASTEIITPHGPRPIESMCVGDLVLTHKGRWRKVRNVMRRDYVGPVVTVQAKGLQPVTATANHPFYVQPLTMTRAHRIETIGDAEWIAADELVPARRQADGRRARGAFHGLTVPRLDNALIKRLDLSEWATEDAVLAETTIRASSNGRATSVHRRPEADYDLGWLIGLFAADGSTTDHQVIFYIGAHEQDITDQLTARLRSVFGVNSTTTVVGGVARTVVSHRILSAFFADCGHNAREKQLPGWSMATGADFQRGMIDGLVAGDGCVYEARMLVRTTSHALAWQIRTLLWASGVNTTLQVQAAGVWEINGRQGASRPMLTVEWRPDSVRRGTMGCADGHVFFQLDSADRSMFSGQVFNLEVDEDESYTTVGGCVHNCRWFGVPPHKVAHLLRSTNNNVESQVIEVVVDSVGPWVKRFEDEANYKLFGQNRQGFFTKMNMNALMRGDPSSRATYYKVMREIGALSADDIRDLEDMNPLPEECGGDKYVMQSQYTTLEQIGEMPEAVEPGPDPEQDMEPEEPEDDPEEMAAMAGIRDLETIHASA